MKSDFQKQMNDFIKANDQKEATFVVLRELGKLLANDKEDFKEVLETAGVLMPYNPDESTLVDLFLQNAPQNKKLLVSAAFYINHKNASSNADGQLEVSDEGVKQAFSLLNEYFDFSNEDEYYNAAADPVSAIAMALGEGAKLGKAITERKTKKEFGAIDAATKLREGKSEMFKALIEKKKAQEQSRTKKQLQQAKTKRIVIIGAVSVAVLLVGIIAFTYLRKK